MKNMLKMDKKTVVLVSLILFSVFSVSFVQSQDKTCIYFFYGQGCPHCAKVEPYLSEMEKKYDLEVYRFEIYNNRSNLVLLQKYFDAYDVPQSQRGVPVVFISDNYFVGDRPILDNLESKIKSFDKGCSCPSLTTKTGMGITGEVSAIEPEKISFLVVTGVALVDSINPCAIAVLLILLSALLASGEKTRAFKAGIAFTVSIYISYFLFGIGLFSAIQIVGISALFYQFVGFLAIIVGIFNIKDYFWYGGGGFLMEIPPSWRPTLKKMLGGVTSPMGAFLMGFLVCLFELPCTGGPYIFILGLLAEKTTQTLAIPILLYYNVLFVLPLIIVSIIVYFGYSSTEKANEWKDKNIRKLHLVAGLIMLILGIVVVFGLI